MPLKFNPAVLFLLAMLVQGCSSTSVFKPYPNQAAEYKAAIANGKIDDVTAKLGSLKQRKDGLLYTQESGRLYQLNNQFEASKQDFAEVYRLYEKQDDKARLSASEIAAQSASLLTNDNALPYQGYGFERIFAIHYQALNYLALGDPQGAAVELRRAAQTQRRLELQHEKEVSKAEENAQKEQITLNEWQNNSQLLAVNQLAGQVKSSFQNAYTFYFSALLWEALGDKNAALVDYKKALEINPSNTTIMQDVVRLDKRAELNPATGHLVVLFEDDFIAERKSFDFAWPYFTGDSITYFTLAFPYYEASAQAKRLSISYDQQAGEAEVIANIDAMAAKALIEKLPAMIVRMILRARAKHELHKQSSEQAGLFGSLLATVYNMVSEQADRRNWLTLPSNVQLFRAPLPLEEQTIELNLHGVSKRIKVTPQAGRVSLVRVVNANGRLLVQQFQL